QLTHGHILPILTATSFSSYRHHRHLPSFPTRRSSDLIAVRGSSMSPLRRFAPPPPHEGEDPRSAGGNFDHLTARQQMRAHIRMRDRKSTRLNSSHVKISYAVFCLKKKKDNIKTHDQ